MPFCWRLCSRATFLEDVGRAVLPVVLPEVAELYRLIAGGDAKPVDTIPRVAALLETLAASTTLRKVCGCVSAAAGANFPACLPAVPLQYTRGLSEVVVGLQLQHLAKVYRTMRLASFEATIAPLKLSADEIEKLFVLSSSHKAPALRVNHALGILQFCCDSPEVPFAFLCRCAAVCVGSPLGIR